MMMTIQGNKIRLNQMDKINIILTGYMVSIFINLWWMQAIDVKNDFLVAFIKLICLTLYIGLISIFIIYNFC